MPRRYRPQRASSGRPSRRSFPPAIRVTAAGRRTWARLQDLTLSIAADYATENIQANCVLLGSVDTPMISGLGAEALQPRRKAVRLQTEGTGWDIEHAASYLVSDEARWVTEAMLPVDGDLLAIRY